MLHQAARDGVGENEAVVDQPVERLSGETGLRNLLQLVKCGQTCHSGTGQLSREITGVAVILRINFCVYSTTTYHHVWVILFC